MQKPLLLKLVLIMLVVTLASVGVTTFFVAHYARDTLRDRVYADLLSDATVVVAWLEDSPADLQRRLVALGGDINKRITIVDADGAVVADSHVDPDTIGFLGNRPEIRAALAGRVVTVERTSETVGEDMVYAAVPVALGGAVRMSAPKEHTFAALLRIFRDIPFVTLIATLLALTVAFLVNRHITDPLHDMLHVTRRLQNGEFGRRVLVRSRDEIGLLGKAFNDLSKTLEEMFDTIHDREGKLNVVLSSMDDGVLAVNRQRQVILANRAAAELSGYDEDMLIGRDQADVLRSVELSDVLCQTMTNDQTLSTEIRLYPGSERTLAVNSSPLEGEEGTTIGAVAVFRDVTDLRRLERMRREFFANVSHELRTPLTSIKGFVETLLNGSLEDSALTKRFLGIVNAETDRMIALINDLLDLSRIESGRVAINVQPVDIYEVFDDTLTILEAKAMSKGISLYNRLDKDLIVLGDAKLLKQVALNLVDNGIKYSQPEGEVWVEGKEIDNEVEITVVDTGVGIPKEHIDRVFERFYRVDRGRSRSMGGTGLGLSIVKHIIDKHQGAIRAESNAGNGTRMKFTLKQAK